MSSEDDQSFELIPPGVPANDIPKLHKIYGDTNGGVSIQRSVNGKLIRQRFAEGLDPAIRATRYIRKNTTEMMEKQFAELATSPDIPHSFQKLMDLTDKGRNTLAKYFFVDWLLNQSRNGTRSDFKEAGLRFELLARRPEFNSSGTPRQREEALKEVSGVTNFMERRAQVLPYLPTVKSTNQLIHGPLTEYSSNEASFEDWIYVNNWKGAAKVLRHAENRIQETLLEHADPNLCCPSD